MRTFGATFRSIQHTLFALRAAHFGKQLLFILAVLTSYIGLRLFLNRWVDHDALNPFSLIPVVGVAWFLGQRAGGVCGLLIFPAHILLANLRIPGSGLEFLWESEFNQIGSIFLILIGVWVGQTRNLQDKLETELQQRQLAETALRQSDIRFKNFIEQVPAAIYMDEVDDNKMIPTAYISPRFGAMLGYSTQQLLSSPYFWDALLHPEDREQALAKDEQHYETAVPLAQEYRMVTQSGRVIWVRDEAVIVRDETAGKTLSQGVLLDITDRKQAEEALKKSEEQFRLVFELSQIGLAITSLDGRYQRVNQTLCNLLGYEATELIGKPYADVTHPEDLETNLMLRKSLLSGEISNFQMEKRYITKTGHIIYVILQVVLVRDEDSRPSHFLAEVVDITAREKSRQELLEREARTRQLYEITSQVSQDIEEQINHVLAEARRLLNLDMGIISQIQQEQYTICYVSAPTMNLHVGQTFPIQNTFCHLVMQKNDVFTLQHVSQSPHQNHPCHTMLQLESYIGVPLQVHGTRYGSLGFAGLQPRNTPFQAAERDFVELLARWVSSAIERKTAEETLAETQKALIQARDQAIAASHAKSELLANVSHELRTPLGAILGHAEILQEGILGPVSERQHKTLGKIISSTNYLTSQVNDLLDMSQLEAGKLKLQLELFSPAHILAQVQAQMSILAESKNLQLITAISDAVPSTLCGDPLRVKQVLINLAGNAIKFTEVGKVEIRFDKPNGRYWSLEVCDSGPGIPLEAQPYIFDAFWQMDNSITRKQKGAGLGLSIVKQLVDLMGGQISLYSNKEEGTTFTVRLPLS